MAYAYTCTYITPYSFTESYMKWFGVPMGLSRSLEVVQLASDAKISGAEAYGRIVMVIEWLAEHMPSGVLDDAQTAIAAAGMSDKAHTAAARRIGASLMRMCVQGNVFTPYAHANEALVNNRERQREFQRKRRAREAQ